MALARIITRSQACSRELALDLLARGYAVEIVSPDAIPDNIADLELRVEEDPGNQLVATVETHNGLRSASIDFVHHLKAPMADFIRRPPEAASRKIGEAVCLPQNQVEDQSVIVSAESSNAESSAESINPESIIAEPESIAAIPQVEATQLSAQIPSAPPSQLDFYPVALSPPEMRKEDERPLVHLASRPVETSPRAYSHLAEEFLAEEVIVGTVGTASTITPPAPLELKEIEAKQTQPARDRHSRNRPASWRWRAALAFASIVLLALLLGFGLSWPGKTSPQIVGAAPVKVPPPSTDDYLLTTAAETSPQKAPIERQASDLGASSPSIKPQANADHATQPLAVAKADPATMKTPVGSGKKLISEKSRGEIAETKGSSHRHDNGLIARDTVTYLDERYRPAPKVQTAKRLAGHPAAHKHSSGVVAASSVTYLNPTPAPTPAK